MQQTGGVNPKCQRHADHQDKDLYALLTSIHSELKYITNEDGKTPIWLQNIRRSDTKTNPPAVSAGGRITDSAGWRLSGLRDDQRPHHVMLFMFKDMAMPDILMTAGPEAHGAGHGCRR